MKLLESVRIGRLCRARVQGAAEPFCELSLCFSAVRAEARMMARLRNPTDGDSAYVGMRKTVYRASAHPEKTGSISGRSSVGRTAVFGETIMPLASPAVVSRVRVPPPGFGFGNRNINNRRKHETGKQKETSSRRRYAERLHRRLPRHPRSAGHCPEGLRKDQELGRYRVAYAGYA